MCVQDSLNVKSVEREKEEKFQYSWEGNKKVFKSFPFYCADFFVLY